MGRGPRLPRLSSYLLARLIATLDAIDAVIDPHRLCRERQWRGDGCGGEEGKEDQDAHSARAHAEEVGSKALTAKRANEYREEGEDKSFNNTTPNEGQGSNGVRVDGQSEDGIGVEGRS